MAAARADVAEQAAEGIAAAAQISAMPVSLSSVTIRWGLFCSRCRSTLCLPSVAIRWVRFCSHCKAAFAPSSCLVTAAALGVQTCAWWAAGRLQCCGYSFCRASHGCCPPSRWLALQQMASQQMDGFAAAVRDGPSWGSAPLARAAHALHVLTA